MVLDTRFFRASDSPRHAVLPENLIGGFLLSRTVMECTDRTLNDYRARLWQFHRFVSRAFPQVSLAEVQRRHIESYLAWLKENGRASWTLRTIYRALKAFYNWMLEEELIKASPLAKIKPPRTPKIRKPFIGEEQRDQLLRICPVTSFMGARSNAMIWLLWSTGMRISELAGLQLASMDWERDRLKLFGKGRKERYVPFSKEAKRAVWRYLAYRNDDLPDLWLTEEQTPLHSPSVREAINRIYERAGVKVKDVCHIFRRSWAYRNIKNGVPTKFVQLVGGWESVTTLERYVEAMDSEEALGAKWV